MAVEVGLGTKGRVEGCRPDFVKGGGGGRILVVGGEGRDGGGGRAFEVGRARLDMVEGAWTVCRTVCRERRWQRAYRSERVAIVTRSGTVKPSGQARLRNYL